jgi:topoisomerase IA-like protein
LDTNGKSDDQTTRPLPKDILRIINTDISVRKGRFGPYIYYKTAEMKKPEFVAMKKCPHDVMNCAPNIIAKWFETRE